MKLALAILFLCAVSAISAPAQSLQLWFTPSPDTNAVGTYVYGSRNAGDFSAGVPPTAWAIKQDAGTNSTIVLPNVAPGVWYFTATAYSADTNSPESAPSNILTVRIVQPPTNIRNHR